MTMNLKKLSFSPEGDEDLEGECYVIRTQQT